MVYTNADCKRLRRLQRLEDDSVRVVLDQWGASPEILQISVDLETCGAFYASRVRVTRPDGSWDEWRAGDGVFDFEDAAAWVREGRDAALSVLAMHGVAGVLANAADTGEIAAPRGGY
jgi:hypothetical protein